MVSLVPSNLRRRINSDADLAKIARELTEWTVVRPFSGLNSVDEETIRINHKDNIENQRFQFLRQWKKKNPNRTFQDLEEMFRQAERMDMVEITHRVAGEETGQDEGRAVSSEQHKGTTREAHHSTQFRLYGVLAVSLLAGCAYLLMRWADGDVSITSSSVDTFKKMAANREGEHNLPWFPPPFIGRDENVSHITNMLLLDPRIRGVHITGAPAIGKSHLAVHVGYELVRHGVNIRYIDVSEMQLLDDTKKVHAIVSDSSTENKQDSRALERKRPNLMLSWFFPQEQKEVLVSASSLVNWARSVKTATIIILDNCDDLLQTDLNHAFMDLTQKLQKASKHIKFISTSRVQYTLVGVKHFPLGLLGENSSSDLLQQECGNFKVEEMKTVADLVGRNPLGLRLAAKLACDVMTVEELVKSLNINSVKALSSETISDKQKMQFVIETSIKYLEKEITLCASNISLFPGSFSKEAGVSILSGCGVEDALYCLNTLSHKSLLEWYVVRGESRYRYHQLVRDSFNTTNLLKSSHCFNYESAKEETFFEQYSIFFTTHLKENLKECETGLSRHCEYWLHDEEHNVGIVLKAINQSSPSNMVEYLLYWSEILRNPTLWKMYGAPNVLRLMHLEMEVIKHRVEQRKVWDVSLVDIYLRFKTEWALYFSFVGFFFSLLLPRFRTFLQSHEKQSLSAVDVVEVNVMAYLASFLSSTTPAFFATWLVLFGASRALPTLQDTSFASPDELIYIFTLLIISGYFFLIFFHLGYNDVAPVPSSCFPAHSLISQSLNVMVKVCDVFFPIMFSPYLQFCYSLFPGFIILLSKGIIVFWFLVMIGAKSFFRPRSNQFLIYLVLSSVNHFPSPKL